MKIKSLTIENFRCFNKKIFSFDAEQVFIVGRNGSGKTSIIEALYYLCYVKSFRSSQLADLISMTYNKKDFFFLSMNTIDDNNIEHTISSGYFEGKREVLVDGKKPNSRKNIFSQFPLFSITEDDLQLVKGEPEIRRNFIDHAITMQDPQALSQLRQLKKALTQRSSLLSQIKESNNEGTTSEPNLLLKSWTHEVWKESRSVRGARGAYLKTLKKHIDVVIKKYWKDQEIEIKLSYLDKKNYATDFNLFWQEHSKIIPGEIALERNLFGAHLDDILIEYKSKKARSFASRGQQKLAVFLIKFSQYLLLKKSFTQSGVLLLDDFITDFDSQNIEKTLKIITDEGLQTIITTPQSPENLLSKEKNQQIIYV